MSGLGLDALCERTPVPGAPSQTPRRSPGTAVLAGTCPAEPGGRRALLPGCCGCACGPRSTAWARRLRAGVSPSCVGDRASVSAPLPRDAVDLITEKRCSFTEEAETLGKRIPPRLEGGPRASRARGRGVAVSAGRDRGSVGSRPAPSSPAPASSRGRPAGGAGPLPARTPPHPARPKVTAGGGSPAWPSGRDAVTMAGRGARGRRRPGDAPRAAGAAWRALSPPGPPCAGRTSALTSRRRSAGPSPPPAAGTKLAGPIKAGTARPRTLRAGPEQPPLDERHHVPPLGLRPAQR